jgi:hypothetical protein
MSSGARGPVTWATRRRRAGPRSAHRAQGAGHTTRRHGSVEAARRSWTGCAQESVALPKRGTARGHDGRASEPQWAAAARAGYWDGSRPPSCSHGRVPARPPASSSGRRVEAEAPAPGQSYYSTVAGVVVRPTAWGCDRGWSEGPTLERTRGMGLQAPPSRAGRRVRPADGNACVHNPPAPSASRTLEARPELHPYYQALHRTATQDPIPDPSGTFVQQTTAKLNVLSTEPPLLLLCRRARLSLHPHPRPTATHKRNLRPVRW